MEKIKRIKTNSNINPSVIDDINANFALLFSIAQSGDNEAVLEKLNSLEENINVLSEKVDQLTSKLTTVESTANSAKSTADGHTSKITTLESNYNSLDSRVTALETPQA